jgi:hypothetical protein
VIHDRDTIYSEGVDDTLEAMGLAVLRIVAFLGLKPAGPPWGAVSVTSL